MCHLRTRIANQMSKRARHLPLLAILPLLLVPSSVSAQTRYAGVASAHQHIGQLDRQTSCFTRADAFLTTRDLGAFTQFHDETDHVAPFKHEAGTNPPLVTEFRVSRMKGFITNLALHGKYRKENDRLARSLGYRIGKWPLVPLQGTIVRDHPGILEAYETHYVWRSLKGARANLTWVRSSVALTPSSAATVTPFPVHLGNDAFGAVTRPVNRAGLHEGTVDVAVRFGKRVLRLQLRGGAAMTSGGALALMQTAMSHVTHASSTPR